MSPEPDRFYSIHLGGDANLEEIGEIHREEKLGSTRPNLDAAEEQAQ